MNYVCHQHGWSSVHQVCPACERFTTSNGTTAKDGHFKQEVERFVPNETIIQPVWGRLAVNKENIQFLCERIEVLEKKLEIAEKGLRSIVNVIPKDFTSREMVIDQICINTFKELYENK